MQPLAVLIVDNEEAVREGLGKLTNWEALSCRIVKAAANAAEALQILSLSPIDIVISDIRMPGMDGLDFAKQLKEQYPLVETIILTAYADFAYAQKALRCQVTDFLTKPLLEENLIIAIEKAKLNLFEKRQQLSLQNQVKREAQKHQLAQQALLLNDLIYNAHLSTLHTLTKARELDLVLTDYILVICHFSEMHKVANSKQVEQRLVRLETHLKDLKSLGHSYLLSRADGNAFCIINTKNVTQAALILTQISKTFEEQEDDSLYLAYSNPQDSLFTLSNAAKEAELALQFALVTDSLCCAYSDLPYQSVTKESGFLNELKKLRLLIEEQNIEESLFEIKRLNEKAIKLGLGSDDTQQLRQTLRLLFSQIAQKKLQHYGECEALLQAAFSNYTFGLEDSLKNSSEAFRPVLYHLCSNRIDLEHSLDQVQDYIDQHLDADLSLETLAGLAYFSPGYLNRQFKLRAQCSLGTYIKNKRIEKAKYLLEYSDKKTFEIAETVGIADPVYFSKLFKKITGLKPTEYRKQRHKGLNF